MARSTAKRNKKPEDYLHLTFRPTAWQFERIERLSKARGVSRGAVIKECVSAHLKAIAA